jgi:hypothetical protein
VSESFGKTPQQHQVHLQIRPAAPELLNVDVLSVLWHVARLIGQHTARWRQSLSGERARRSCVLFVFSSPKTKLIVILQHCKPRINP